MKMKFCQWDCKILFGYYSNGRIAILLIDEADSSPVAVATIDLPEVALLPREIIVKDYSENEGMVQALFDGNVIKMPARRVVETGFVKAPICELTDPAMAEMLNQLAARASQEDNHE